LKKLILVVTLSLGLTGVSFAEKSADKSEAPKDNPYATSKLVCMCGVLSPADMEVKRLEAKTSELEKEAKAKDKEYRHSLSDSKEFDGQKHRKQRESEKARKDYEKSLAELADKRRKTLESKKQLSLNFPCTCPNGATSYLGVDNSNQTPAAFREIRGQ